MKTIEDIRLENTRTLVSRFNTLSDFAEGVDRSATQMSRLVGKNPTKAIGSKMARHIESQMGLPEGWLDSEHLSKSDKSREKPTEEAMYLIGGRNVPILSYVQAGAFCNSETQVLPYDCDMILCPAPNASELTYALKVVGDSMTAPHGKSYPEGSVIFVDPLKSACTGKRVIARTTKGQTFKELAENEFGEWYLKPLNPSHPPIMEEGIEVCGVVIGSYNPE